MQKPDWLKRKGRGCKAKGRQKINRGGWKLENKWREMEREENAKEVHTVSTGGGEVHVLPSESFSVSLLLILSEQRTADWWHRRQLKTFILSAQLRKCFQKDWSGGMGPTLEYPGRLEMPWPSSEGGCGCPWCSSSYGALAASTPASLVDFLGACSKSLQDLGLSDAFYPPRWNGAQRQDQTRGKSMWMQ